MSPEELSRVNNYYKMSESRTCEDYEYHSTPTEDCSSDSDNEHHEWKFFNAPLKAVDFDKSMIDKIKLCNDDKWTITFEVENICNSDEDGDSELDDENTEDDTEDRIVGFAGPGCYDKFKNHDITVDLNCIKEPEPEQKPAEEDDESFMTETDYEYADALNLCRDIFSSKLEDYGTAWRIMRPQSVTDQIYIKANRIRSLEECGISKVGEGILPEFMAIVNYGIVGLIQLELGFSDSAEDLPADRALELYDKYAQTAYELMNAKNHDYNEAWRLMRVCSYTDFILMKICRTKQIESHNGKTKVSEGIDANYLDMINYAIFAIIKMTKNSD